MHFENIEYLKSGNRRQQQAYDALTGHHIMETLKPYTPLLVGTIPINIDIDGSDLDIICCVENFPEFTTCVTQHFGHKEKFTIHETSSRGSHCIVVNFTIGDFPVELFGQAIPSVQQAAYIHMLTEYRIIQEQGEAFRQHVIRLKQQGVKTEPAFATLLGLTGDPYVAILRYYE